MAQDKEPVKSTSKAPCSLPNTENSPASLNTNSIAVVKKTCDASVQQESSSNNHASSITLHNLLLSGKEVKNEPVSLTNGSSKGKIRPVSMQSLLCNGMKTVSVEAAAARLRSTEVTITKVKSFLPHSPPVAAEIIPELCMTARDDRDETPVELLPTEPVCVIKEEPVEEAGCDIAYVCRGCGEEFFSKALGGYYYCPRCSGLYVACSVCQVHFYCPVKTTTPPLCVACCGATGSKRKRDAATGNDRDRLCMACKTPFRCGGGDWNYCGRCVAKSTSELGTPFKCKTCGNECRTTLEQCFHCARCTSLYTVTRRSANAPYQRFTCVLCSAVFYSCGKEKLKCSNCVKRGRPPAQTFIRRDITYVRRSCVTCSVAFYSSTTGSDQCRKCRLQEEGEGDESEEQEEDKWANVVYEKYTCQVCGNPFYSRAGDYRFCGDCNPETRIEKHPIWRCAHCSFKSFLKRELRAHLLGVPRSIKCRCSVCVNTAPPSDEVPAKKTYSCRKCSYMTAHKKRYKTHKLIHKVPEARSTPCRFCKFIAPNASELRRHVFKDHRKSVTMCKFCEYMTKQRGRMKRHIKETHANESNIPSKERFVCERCNYTTVQRTRYHNHLVNCFAGIEMQSESENGDKDGDDIYSETQDDLKEPTENNSSASKEDSSVGKEEVSSESNDKKAAKKRSQTQEESKDPNNERKRKNSTNIEEGDGEEPETKVSKEDNKSEEVTEKTEPTKESTTEQSKSNATSNESEGGREESPEPLYRCSEALTPSS